MDRRRPPRRSPWRVVLLAAALASATAACDREQAADEPLPIGVDAYTVAIEEFFPVAAADDAERPVVYVTMLGEEPFELDDQVALIEAVHDDYDLRFVDSPDAAVDGEEPRDEAMLLGVGTVSPAPPHLLRVEVYTGTADPIGYLLTLEPGNQRWRVTAIEQVEPEGLVVGE